MFGDVVVLVRHNTILRLRDPGHLLSYLVMPMVLMVVLKPLYTAALPDGETRAVVGLLVMFSTLSLAVVGTAMLSERTWRTWDRLQSLPVSITAVLLGKAIPVWGLLMVQQLLLIVFGSQVIGMETAGPVLLVAAVAVWGATLLALGMLLAVFVRSHGELSAACDIGGLAVSTLGGALAPVSLMPGWAQAVAPVSPGYWAVRMLNAAVAGDAGAMLRPVVVLVAVGCAAGALAGLRIRSGLGELRG